MNKKQVRPRVDKELFDKVVEYCGGGETFCESLKWMIRDSKRNELLAERSGRTVNVQIKTIDKLSAHIRDIEQENEKLKVSIKSVMSLNSKLAEEANKMISEYPFSIEDMREATGRYKDKATFWLFVSCFSIGINISFLMGLFS